MAGHSHWHNIQQKKGKLDQKKGAIFTKMSQQIILAAREGGGDPEHNLSLKIAIDNAKAVNMPKDSIERAVLRGSGGGADTQLFKVLYEGFTPHSVPIIIFAITDSKNRTVGELRTIFSQNNGMFGESGSVSWQFDEVGFVEVRCAKIKKAEKFGVADEEVAIPSDEVQLDLMDIAGVKDIEVTQNEDGEHCEVVTDMTSLAQVTQAIKEKGYIVISSSQHFIPQNPVNLTDSQKETVEAFIDKISDQADVQKFWVALP